MALKPTEELIKYQISTRQTTTAAYSAYDLPIVEALLRYRHAASGFPVKSTWLWAIKKGNLTTWTGLTYSNAENIFHVQWKNQRTYGSILARSAIHQEKDAPI